MASVHYTPILSPSPLTNPSFADPYLSHLIAEISAFLDQNKAEDIVAINLNDKTSIADSMLIATGRSQRHIAALADNLKAELAKHDYGNVFIEGGADCDWVLIDAGTLIIHLFLHETRALYNLEKMWGESFPPQA